MPPYSNEHLASVDNKFFWPNWMEILIIIEEFEVKDMEVYPTKLYKQMFQLRPKITPQTIYDWISILENNKLIRKQKNGRIKHLKLTTAGKELVTHLHTTKLLLQKQFSTIKK